MVCNLFDKKMCILFRISCDFNSSFNHSFDWIVWDNYFYSYFVFKLFSKPWYQSPPPTKNVPERTKSPATSVGNFFTNSLIDSIMSERGFSIKLKISFESTKIDVGSPEEISIPCTLNTYWFRKDRYL